MADPIHSVESSSIPKVHPATAKALVRDGDLFFSSGHLPAAMMIRLVTGSPLSHTGFLFRDGDTIKTLESTFTQGVHAGDGDDYLQMGDGPVILARLKDSTPEDVAKYMARARSLVGRHYEVGEEIEMALRTICPFLRVKAEYRELFCSGMVQDALHGSSWPIPKDASGGNATPADVWACPFVVPICAVVSC